MSSFADFLVPAVASLGTRARDARRRGTRPLVAAAFMAAVLAVAAVASGATGTLFGGFLRLDATSRLFLAVVNPVFLGVAVYVRGRLVATPALRDITLRFVGLAVGFLVAADTVLVANHLLLLALALEASTLAAAPLIVRTGVRASRQASWRYFLFSSVGLGFFSLGLGCLARGMEASGLEVTFFLDRLPGVVGATTNAWTRLGVGLCLLGLGTKLGLAPMYSWLPEAYDEAPPAVTALLGAVQFNCALVALFRIIHVYRPGNGALISGTLLTMGIVSMLVSTLSIIATRNMKRLIAYAAINHAGVIAIGLGVGRAAIYGLLLYVLCNAFIKAILFLTAGKIEAHYRTKDTRRISGLLQHLPYSGVFLMVGTFALLGFPPFGSFVGELLILSALVGANQILVFSAFCVLITMTFVATGRTMFPMIWAESKEKREWPPQTLLSAAPKILFLVALVALGLYIPAPVNQLIKEVAASLGGA